MMLKLLLEAETQKQRLLHVQQALIDELPDGLEIDVNHDYKGEPPVLFITGTKPNKAQLTDSEPYIIRVPMPGSSTWARAEVTVTRTAAHGMRRELYFEFPRELADMVTCIVKDNFDIWRDRWV